MRNSLQSVYKHSFNNIFNNLGKSDISYSLNFFLIKKIAKKLNLNVAGLTDQGSFLTNFKNLIIVSIAIFSDDNSQCCPHSNSKAFFLLFGSENS